jgi:hypothetical protein
MIATALGISLVSACGLVAYARSQPVQMPEVLPVGTTYTLLEYSKYRGKKEEVDKWWGQKVTGHETWNLVIIATQEGTDDIVIDVRTGQLYSPISGGTSVTDNNGLVAEALAYLYTTQNESDVNILTDALCKTDWYGVYLNEDIDIGQARVSRLEGWVDFAGALAFNYQRGDADARLLRSNPHFTNWLYADLIEGKHQSTRGTKRAVASVASIACPVFASTLAVSVSDRPLVACAIFVSALAAIGAYFYVNSPTDPPGAGGSSALAGGGGADDVHDDGTGGGGAGGSSFVGGGAGGASAGVTGSKKTFADSLSHKVAVAGALATLEVEFEQVLELLSSKTTASVFAAIRRYADAIGITRDAKSALQTAQSRSTRKAMAIPTSRGTNNLEDELEKALTVLAAAEQEETNAKGAADNLILSEASDIKEAYTKMIDIGDRVDKARVEKATAENNVTVAADAIVEADGGVPGGIAMVAFEACNRALDAQVEAASALGLCAKKVREAEQSAAQHAAADQIAARIEGVYEQHPDATPMRTFSALSFASQGRLRAMEMGSGIDRGEAAFARANRAASESCATSNSLKDDLEALKGVYDAQRDAFQRKLDCERDVARTSKAQAAAFEVNFSAKPVIEALDVLDALLMSRLSSRAKIRPHAVPWSNFGTGAYSLNAYQSGKTVYSKQGKKIPPSMFHSISDIVKSVNESANAPVQLQHDPVTNALFLKLVGEATSAAFAIDPYGPGGESMACTIDSDATDGTVPYTWIDLDANAALYVAAASLSPHGILAKQAEAAHEAKLTLQGLLDQRKADANTALLNEEALGETAAVRRAQITADLAALDGIEAISVLSVFSALAKAEADLQRADTEKDMNAAKIARIDHDAAKARLLTLAGWKLVDNTATVTAVELLDAANVALARATTNVLSEVLDAQNTFVYDLVRYEEAVQAAEIAAAADATAADMRALCGNAFAWKKYFEGLATGIGMAPRGSTDTAARAYQMQADHMKRMYGSPLIADALESNEKVYDAVLGPRALAEMDTGLAQFRTGMVSVTTTRPDAMWSNFGSGEYGLELDGQAFSGTIPRSKFGSIPEIVSLLNKHIRVATGRTEFEIKHDPATNSISSVNINNAATLTISPYSPYGAESVGKTSLSDRARLDALKYGLIGKTIRTAIDALFVDLRGIGQSLIDALVQDALVQDVVNSVVTDVTDVPGESGLTKHRLRLNLLDNKPVKHVDIEIGALGEYVEARIRSDTAAVWERRVDATMVSYPRDGIHTGSYKNKTKGPGMGNTTEQIVDFVAGEPAAIWVVGGGFLGSTVNGVAPTLTLHVTRSDNEEGTAILEKGVPTLMPLSFRPYARYPEREGIWCTWSAGPEPRRYGTLNLNLNPTHVGKWYEYYVTGSDNGTAVRSATCRVNVIGKREVTLEVEDVKKAEEAEEAEEVENEWNWEQDEVDEAAPSIAPQPTEALPSNSVISNVNVISRTVERALSELFRDSLSDIADCFLSALKSQGVNREDTVTNYQNKPWQRAKRLVRWLLPSSTLEMEIGALNEYATARLRATSTNAVTWERRIDAVIVWYAPDGVYTGAYENDGGPSTEMGLSPRDFTFRSGVETAGLWVVVGGFQGSDVSLSLDPAQTTETPLRLVRSESGAIASTIPRTIGTYPYRVEAGEFAKEGTINVTGNIVCESEAKREVAVGKKGTVEFVFRITTTDAHRSRRLTPPDPGDADKSRVDANVTHASGAAYAGNDKEEIGVSMTWVADTDTITVAFDTTYAVTNARVTCQLTLVGPSGTSTVHDPFATCTMTLTGGGGVSRKEGDDETLYVKIGSEPVRITFDIVTTEAHKLRGLAVPVGSGDPSKLYMTVSDSDRHGVQWLSDAEYDGRLNQHTLTQKENVYRMSEIGFDIAWDTAASKIKVTYDPNGVGTKKVYTFTLVFVGPGRIHNEVTSVINLVGEPILWLQNPADKSHDVEIGANQKIAVDFIIRTTKEHRLRGFGPPNPGSGAPSPELRARVTRTNDGYEEYGHRLADLGFSAAWVPGTSVITMTYDPQGVLYDSRYTFWLELLLYGGDVVDSVATCTINRVGGRGVMLVEPAKSSICYVKGTLDPITVDFDIVTTDAHGGRGLAKPGNAAVDRSRLYMTVKRLDRNDDGSYSPPKDESQNTVWLNNEEYDLRRGFDTMLFRDIPEKSIDDIGFSIAWPVSTSTITVTYDPVKGKDAMYEYKLHFVDEVDEQNVQQYVACRMVPVAPSLALRLQSDASREVVCGGTVPIEILFDIITTDAHKKRALAPGDLADKDKSHLSMTVTNTKSDQTWTSDTTERPGSYAYTVAHPTGVGFSIVWPANTSTITVAYDFKSAYAAIWTYTLTFVGSDTTQIAKVVGKITTSLRPDGAPGLK